MATEDTKLLADIAQTLSKLLRQSGGSSFSVSGDSADSTRDFTKAIDTAVKSADNYSKSQKKQQDQTDQTTDRSKKLINALDGLSSEAYDMTKHYKAQKEALQDANKVVRDVYTNQLDVAKAGSALPAMLKAQGNLLKQNYTFLQSMQIENQSQLSSAMSQLTQLAGAAADAKLAVDTVLKLQKTFDTLNKEAARSGETLTMFDTRLGESMGDYTERLEEAAKQLEVLGGDSKELTNAIDKLKENFQATDLAADAFKDGVGESTINIIGFDRALKDAVSSWEKDGSQHQEAIKKQLDDLSKLTTGTGIGKNFGSLSEISEHLEGTLRDFNGVASQAADQATKDHKTVEGVNTVLGKFGHSLESLEKGMSGAAGKFFLLEEALKTLKNVYGQVRAMQHYGYGNTASDLATFGGVGQAKTGLSSKELLALTQQAGQTAVAAGASGYADLLGSNRHNAIQSGMDSKEAAQFNASAIDLATSTGTVASDFNDLSGRIGKTQDQFEHLRATAGTTAEQFIALQKDLINDSATRQNLARLSKSERNNMIDRLTLERQQLTQTGIQVETAQELIKLQEQQKNNSVSTRLSEGTHLAAAAALSGNGGDAGRIMQLAANKHRSAQEDAEFQALQKKIGVSEQGFQSGDLASQARGDAIDAQLGQSGAAGRSATTLATEGALNGGKALTDAQVAQRQSDGRMASGLASAEAGGDSLSALFGKDSSLVGAIGEFVKAVGAFVLFNSLGGASGIVSKIGGLAGFGGAAAGAAEGAVATGAATAGGGLLAGAGGALAGGAAMAGGAALVGGAGYAGYKAGGWLNDNLLSGHNSKGEVTSTVGNTLYDWLNPNQPDPTAPTPIVRKATPSPASQASNVAPGATSSAGVKAATLDDVTGYLKTMLSLLASLDRNGKNLASLPELNNHMKSLAVGLQKAGVKIQPLKPGKVSI